MQKYVVIEKRAGRTPLMELNELRKRETSLASQPMTYAGRLDPMASGKLLILIGEECKKRKEYDALDKEYEFEILFGFSTDTGDILGLPLRGQLLADNFETNMNAVLRNLLGPISLPYPAFSSKTVQGKPLFEYALEGTIEDIDIPIKHGRIYTMGCVNFHTEVGNEMLSRISDRLQGVRVEKNTGTVSADFRRDEIVVAWEKVIHPTTIYRIGKFKATASSGIYIRSLAPLIAEKLGAAGLAYSINRTRIGRYLPVTSSWGIWTKTFK